MKITKTKRKELESLADAVNAARTELEAAVEKYNGARDDFVNAVEAEADELQSTFDDRSARWQESDVGTATCEWIDSVRTAAEIDEAEFDIEEVVLDFTDEPGDA